MSRRPAAPLTALVLLACGATGCRPEYGGGPAAAVSVDATGGAAAVGEGGAAVLDPPAADDPVPADDAHGWPLWRGPNRNGVAPGADPPVVWSAERNVVWRTPVPGRGHSSPCVSDGRIYLTTADGAAGTQSVLAFDADTGEPLWDRRVSRGGLPTSGVHAESSHASATPAHDGERVIVAFLHDGRVWASAHTPDGERAWGEVDVGPFVPQFGYSPSPTLFGPLAIVAGDSEGVAWLAALDRATGTVRWRVDRGGTAGHSAPLCVNVGGRDLIVLAGQRRLAAYDPADGSLVWEEPGLARTVAGTAVHGVASDGTPVLVASGGYPEQETLAVTTDGDTARVLWRNDLKAYVPSPLLADGLLYLVADDGRTRCLDALTGDQRWQARLRGSRFRPSPVWAAGRVYVTSNDGRTTVFTATGDLFEPLAENPLGDECYASPAVVGDRLYFRVAEGSGGDRRETLVCVGE